MLCTDRQPDRKTGTQTDRQIHRHIGKQVYTYTDRHTVRQMRTHKEIDRQTDAYTHTDRRTHTGRHKGTRGLQRCIEIDIHIHTDRQIALLTEGEIHIK